MELEQDHIEEDDIAVREKEAEPDFSEDFSMCYIKSEPVDNSVVDGGNNESQPLEDPLFVAIKVEPNMESSSDKSLLEEDFDLSDTAEGHFEESTTFDEDGIHETETATSVVSTTISDHIREQSIPESTMIKSHKQVLGGENFRISSRCESSFTTSLDISKKPFRCSQCGRAFTQNSDLTRHMRIHSGEKPYKCSQCGKAFSQSSTLTGHMRIHSGEKPYKCSQCGKAFSENGTLTAHMRIHSGEKPYKCSQCGRAFSRSSHLASHKRIHSGEKLCKCSQCGKTYTRSSDLKKHMRIHSGEKPP